MKIEEIRCQSQLRLVLDISIYSITKPNQKMKEPRTERKEGRKEGRKQLCCAVVSNKKKGAVRISYHIIAYRVTNSQFICCQWSIIQQSKSISINQSAS